MNSPCVGLCVYDHKHDHCAGCYRTLKEIEGWYTMADDQKRQVLKNCKDRSRAQRKRNEVCSSGQ